MLKNLKIKHKLLLIIILTILMISIIITLKSIYSINLLTNKNIENFRSDSYNKKEKELENYVNLAHTTMKYYYELSKNKELSFKYKKAAIKTIENMRYAGNNYFWVQNKSSIMIMHPINKALIGKNLSNIQDANGKYIFKDILKTVNNENKSGSLKYMWTKPNNKTIQEKLSYVKVFEPWGYIIGTGAYIDDIEKNISIMKQNASKEINNIVLQIIFISLLTSIILSFIVIYITNVTIIKPIERFQNSLVEFFKYLNKENDFIEELKINSNDEIGTMSSIVNENIQNTKKLIEQDQLIINDVSSLVKKISSGELSERINRKSDNPAIKILIVELNTMMENLQNKINHSLNVLKSYQNNDFRVKTTIKCKGEINDLMEGINDLGETITLMLIENKQNGLTLNNSAQKLQSNVKILNTSSNEGSISLEEASSSLEQITGNIGTNVENISLMSNIAKNLTKSAKEGNALANKTTLAMDEINTQVSSINEAITVIDQIAFQTNILSLNAAVESATAGEAGKGFAVVAQEVRNLANRSSEAAKEIKNLVENATHKTNDGKNISDKMISGYSELNSYIEKTMSLMDEISIASKEQQKGIVQINNAVSELDQQTKNNLDVAIKTNNISNQTSKIAQTVVNNANNKEFIGKDDVKAKCL